MYRGIVDDTLNFVLKRATGKMKSKLDKWAKSFVTSCVCKKRYKSAGFAEAVAQKILAERGIKLYCYWCNQCGGFHLTSRPPKNSKETMERAF